MDWSDPAVNFDSGRLDRVLRDFCDSTLEDIRKQALGFLDRLRASRVTLDFLRQVSSAEMVSGKTTACNKGKGTSPVSVMMPLNEEATNRVKGYLRRKVEKLKHSDGQEFRNLVPQNRENFEKGFDAFVEKCMEKKDAEQSMNSWLEEHVTSGAAQPQLWKIYVSFQRQLRETCAVQSRKPLPPPLFMQKEEEEQCIVEQQTAKISSPVCHTYPALPSRPIATAPAGYTFDPYAPTAHPSPPQHHPLPQPAAATHGRTQSCAEYGRLIPVHAHGYHPPPLSQPYVMVPFHVRQGSLPGYHTTAPSPHEAVQYSEQGWVPGQLIHDDKKASRGCYEATMVSPGYQYVTPTPRLYAASESPPVGVGIRYYTHGRLA